MMRLLLFSLGLILLIGAVGYAFGLMLMAARIAFYVWLIVFVIHVIVEWKRP